MLIYVKTERGNHVKSFLLIFMGTATIIVCGIIEIIALEGVTPSNSLRGFLLKF